MVYNFPAPAPFPAPARFPAPAPDPQTYGLGVHDTPDLMQGFLPPLTVVQQPLANDYQNQLAQALGGQGASLDANLADAQGQTDKALARIAAVNPELARTLSQQRGDHPDHQSFWGGLLHTVASSPIGKALEIISRPAHIIPELLTDHTDSVWKNIGDALSGHSTATMGDWLKQEGVFQGNDIFSHVARSATGFFLDMATDPLMYMTAGLGSVGRAAATRFGSELAAKAVMFEKGGSLLDHIGEKLGAEALGTTARIGSEEARQAAFKLFWDASTGQRASLLKLGKFGSLAEDLSIVDPDFLGGVLGPSLRDGEAVIAKQALHAADKAHDIIGRFGLNRLGPKLADELGIPKEAMQQILKDARTAGAFGNKQQYMEARFAGALEGGVRFRISLPGVRMMTPALWGTNKLDFSIARRFFAGLSGQVRIMRAVESGAINPDVGAKALELATQGGWKNVAENMPEMVQHFGGVAGRLGSAFGTASSQIGGITRNLGSYSLLRGGGLGDAMASDARKMVRNVKSGVVRDSIRLAHGNKIDPELLKEMDAAGVAQDVMGDMRKRGDGILNTPEVQRSLHGLDKTVRQKTGDSRLIIRTLEAFPTAEEQALGATAQYEARAANILEKYGDDEVRLGEEQAKNEARYEESKAVEKALKDVPEAAFAARIYRVVSTQAADTYRGVGGHVADITRTTESQLAINPANREEVEHGHAALRGKTFELANPELETSADGAGYGTQHVTDTEYGRGYLFSETEARPGPEVIPGVKPTGGPVPEKPPKVLVGAGAPAEANVQTGYTTHINADGTVDILDGQGATLGTYDKMQDAVKQLKIYQKDIEGLPVSDIEETRKLLEHNLANPQSDLYIPPTDEAPGVNLKGALLDSNEVSVGDLRPEDVYMGRIEDLKKYVGKREGSGGLHYKESADNPVVEGGKTQSFQDFADSVKGPGFAAPIRLSFDSNADGVARLTADGAHRLRLAEEAGKSHAPFYIVDESGLPRGAKAAMLPEQKPILMGPQQLPEDIRIGTIPIEHPESDLPHVGMQKQAVLAPKRPVIINDDESKLLKQGKRPIVSTTESGFDVVAEADQYVQAAMDMFNEKWSDQIPKILNSKKFKAQTPEVQKVLKELGLEPKGMTDEMARLVLESQDAMAARLRTQFYEDRGYDGVIHIKDGKQTVLVFENGVNTGKKAPVWEISHDVPYTKPELGYFHRRASSEVHAALEGVSSASTERRAPKDWDAHLARATKDMNFAEAEDEYKRILGEMGINLPEGTPMMDTTVPANLNAYVDGMSNDVGNMYLGRVAKRLQATGLTRNPMLGNYVGPMFEAVPSNAYLNTGNWLKTQSEKLYALSERAAKLQQRIAKGGQKEAEHIEASIANLNERLHSAIDEETRITNKAIMTAPKGAPEADAEAARAMIAQHGGDLVKLRKAARGVDLTPEAKGILTRHTETLLTEESLRPGLAGQKLSREAELSRAKEKMDWETNTMRDVNTEWERIRHDAQARVAEPKVAMGYGPPDHSGMSKILVPGLEGMYMPALMADEFNVAARGFKGLNEFQKVWRRSLSWWKEWATWAWPGFHIRNAMGGWFNNWLGGVEFKDYVEVGRAMRARREVDRGLPRKWAETKLSKEFLRNHGLIEYYFGSEPTYADLAKLFTDNAINSANSRSFGEARIGAELLDKEMAKPANSPWTLVDKAFGKNVAAGKPGRAIAHGLRSTGEMTENALRGAAFLQGLKQTHGDFMGAHTFTMMRHGDYGDLTDWEYGAIRDVLPFYKWMRTNVPLQVHQLFENPAKILSMLHARKAMFDLSGIDMNEANAKMPGWATQGFSFPAPGSTQDAINLVTADLPVNDLYQGAGEFFSQMLPMARPFLESYVINKSIFTGKPMTGKPIPVSWVSDVPFLGKMLQSMRIGNIGADGKYYIDDKLQNVLSVVPVVSRFRNWVYEDPSRARLRTQSLVSMIAGVGLRPFNEQDFTSAELDFYQTTIIPTLADLKAMGYPLPTSKDLEAAYGATNNVLAAAGIDARSGV